MNDTGKTFEEINEPKTSIVVAPIGTGTSAVESAIEAANYDDGIVGKIGKYR